MIKNRHDCKTQEKIEDELYRIGLFVPVFLLLFGGILYLIKYFDIIPLFCILSDCVGVYCPGCGGTRAVIALLQGKIFLSVWYHPFVLYSVVLYLGFMGTHLLRRIGLRDRDGWKYHDWYIWIGLLIIVFNFILKNVLRLYFHITM